MTLIVLLLSLIYFIVARDVTGLVCATILCAAWDIRLGIESKNKNWVKHHIYKSPRNTDKH